MEAGGAVTLAKEASHIISVKYPDLSGDFQGKESFSKTRSSSPRTPPGDRLPVVPHSKYVKLIPMNRRCDGVEDSASSPYMEGDALEVVSVAQLKPESLSSMLLHVRTTPNKKAKRSSRPPQLHITAGLKHKLLRLCGAPRSIFSSEYMSLPG